MSARLQPALAHGGKPRAGRKSPKPDDVFASGIIVLHRADAQALTRIAALLRKYQDLDPDWADVALVRLAEHTGIRRIATVDVNDFSIYRIQGRTRFELTLLT